MLGGPSLVGGSSVETQVSDSRVSCSPQSNKRRVLLLLDLESFPVRGPRSVGTLFLDLELPRPVHDDWGQDSS